MTAVNHGSYPQWESFVCIAPIYISTSRVWSTQGSISILSARTCQLPALQNKRKTLKDSVRLWGRWIYKTGLKTGQWYGSLLVVYFSETSMFVDIAHATTCVVSTCWCEILWRAGVVWICWCIWSHLKQVSQTFSRRIQFPTIDFHSQDLRSISISKSAWPNHLRYHHLTRVLDSLYTYTATCAISLYMTSIVLFAR